jgi:hypothetical protein
MKINLQQDLCYSHWACLNINKECCQPEPEVGKWYVDCKHYVKKVGMK